MKVTAHGTGREHVDPDKYVVIDHGNLEGQDFSGRVLHKFSAIGSRFVRCRFENMVISDASLGSGIEVSEYTDCSFVGSVLPIRGYARFVGCNFGETRLYDLTADYLEFVDCTFTGRLEKIVFWGSPPPAGRASYGSLARRWERAGRGVPPESYRQLVYREVNEFRGNNFSAATFDDVSFRGGIDLSLQRLPIGRRFLYIMDAERCLSSVLNHGRDAASASLDDRAFDYAKAILERNLKTGQKQLFLEDRAHDSTTAKPMIKRAYQILRSCAPSD